MVISAGFAETGAEGAERQQELLRVCRDAGMRLIGPNCLGIVNTAPEVRLDATFGPMLPARGRVGFLSQTGALGLAIIDYANALGLGLSSFVSVGNKADISGNDLLDYWEQDDPAPTWSCSTWSRSATRASSPGSPAGSAGPSRSWRSRAAARRPGPGPPPPTPAPCSPPPT